MIEYHIARLNVDGEPDPLPGVDESKFLDYVIAANGNFARGRRPGLEVCMPVSVALQEIRGLRDVMPYVQWGFPRVPEALVSTMLMVAQQVCNPMPREVLYYLTFDGQSCAPGHLICDDGWHLIMPAQAPAGPGRAMNSVKPLESGFGTASACALIEVHSHHAMKAEFSEEDDADESQGFRIYAVMGEIFHNAKIRARVGLFGHFFEYSAMEFFILPNSLTDCLPMMEFTGQS